MKAIIFAGIEEGREVYQLLIGTKYFTREEYQNENIKSIAVEASEMFAEVIAEESQTNKTNYEIVLGNGKKLEVNLQEKAEVKDIERLKELSINTFRTNLSKRLTDLIKNQGMLIDLQGALN